VDAALRLTPPFGHHAPSCSRGACGRPGGGSAGSSGTRSGRGWWSAWQLSGSSPSRDGNPGHSFLASGETPARGSILPHLSAVSAAESGRMRMSPSGGRFLRTPTSRCSRGPSRGWQSSARAGTNPLKIRSPKLFKRTNGEQQYLGQQHAAPRCIKAHKHCQLNSSCVCLWSRKLTE